MRQLHNDRLNGQQALERRSQARQKMVLRVGVLEAGGQTSFCLVKNISSRGVQVKLYSSLELGCDLTLTVGDKCPLRGRLMWVQDQLGGIEFKEPLTESSLLRVTQNLSGSRRRSSPRANTAAHVVLTTNGRSVWGELCDISPSGARVRTRRPLVADSSLILSVRGMPPLRAFIRWSAEEEIGVAFAAPMPVEILAAWLSERNLIES